MAWYAGTHSTDVSNNTGWIFTAPPGSGIAYNLSCANGAYSYTGNAATLDFNAGATAYGLSAGAGSYAINGQIANLSVARKYALNCDSGTYSITGQAATLIYTPGSGTVNYLLSVENGNYALTGQQAALTYSSGAKLIFGGARPWDKIVIEAKDFEEDDEEAVIMMLIQELAELI